MPSGAVSDTLNTPASTAGGMHLGEVVSVKDPTHLGQVQVRMYSFDGLADQDGPIWARVAVPYAGANRGCFMVPDVGDEVLISFIGQDPNHPVVVGGLWNGAAGPPETLGGSGDRVDRWTFVGKAGTRIAIVEENPGEATISLSTPGQVSVVMTQAAGGSVQVQAAGTTITVDTQGVSVKTGATVKVTASTVDVTAGSVKVNSALADFSGVVKCAVLQTESVISKAYTPGVGNVW